MSKRTIQYQGGAKRYTKRAPSYARTNTPYSSAYRTSGGPPRIGYDSVARTRGAAVTGEMKYYDVGASAAVLSADTSWTGCAILPAVSGCLFAPIQGPAVDQRIGKSCKVLYLKIRGHIELTSQTAQGAPKPGCFARLLVVQDMQPNAVIFDPNLLMADGPSAALTVNGYQDYNQFGRYKVLKDKIIVLNDPNLVGTVAGSTVANGGIIRPFKFNIKFKVPVEFRFNAAGGGTFASLVNNSFAIACASNRPPGVNEPQMVLTYISRVCYKE